MSRGRHARPGKTTKAINASATAGTTAFTAGALALAAAGGHTAPQHIIYMPAATATAHQSAAHPVTTQTGPGHYTVQPGDTLSAIAGTHCGNPADYPALAAASAIPDPDVINPGQQITLDCTTTAVTTGKDADGDTPGGTYGHPYTCGDGDGDGWDMPCSELHHHAAPAQQDTPAHDNTVTVASSSGSDFSAAILTPSEVESAWAGAGGPSWAAPAAVRIARCESGFNRYAHNPSGATGLFQILGSVVPGDLTDAHINALNAVAKFKASGDSWAQWVCQP